MKKTALKRKTPLRSKKGFSSTNTRKTAKKRAQRNSGPKKRRKKSDLQRLKGKLWEECKRVIRKRYMDHNGNWKCYTCDAVLDEPRKAQTGHFIPSSVCSTELRYDLDNLRVQCYQCNINKSGNWVEYEKRLKKEKGADFPEKLKARNESTKGLMYREDWYEMYLSNYKEL